MYVSRQDALRLAVPLLLLGGSALILVEYEGGVCFGTSALWILLTIPVVFSLGLIWLAAEFFFWIAGRRIENATTAGALSLTLAAGLHLAAGAAAMLTLSNTPEDQGVATRALVWVPSWMFGLLFEIGRLEVCR